MLSIFSHGGNDAILHPMTAYWTTTLRICIGEKMSWLTILSGMVSGLLLIYLLYALIKPENF